MNIYCICIMLIQERKLTHLFLLEMALENFFIYNKYNHLTAYYGYQMHKDHSYLLIVKKTSYFHELYGKSNKTNIYNNHKKRCLLQLQYIIFIYITCLSI